jgi:hypothetical protein
MLTGIALSANPGDKAASYKNNTAYLLSQTRSENGVEDSWALRTGPSENWKRLETAFRQGTFGIIIYRKINEDWYGRIVAAMGGMMMQDTGWIFLKEKWVLLNNLTDDMTGKYVYLEFVGTGWEDNNTTIKVYENTSKSYVEGLIYEMARKDYIEGQEGHN